MAAQSLVVGTAYTAPLQFLDGAGKPTVGPPTGSVSASVPTGATVALSANGQFVNLTMLTTTTLTLTYHGVGAGAVNLTASADVSGTTGAVVTTFGLFSPGTTP